MIHSQQEVFFEALRKLASPRATQHSIDPKITWGDKYQHVDLADFLTRLVEMLTMVGLRRLDVDSPFFIAGLQRSGTTLFCRILDANSHLFMFNECFPSVRLNGCGVPSTRNIYYYSI